MKKLYVALLALGICLGAVAQAKSPTKKVAVAPASWAAQAVAAKQVVQQSFIAPLPLVTEVMTKGMVAKKIDLDLTGLKELVLMADPTADGNGSDHALWANAYLTKADGTKVGLDKIAFKVHRVGGNWWSVNKNFSDRALSIADKEYPQGVIAHAASVLVIDLTKEQYKKFEAEVGIDNGSPRGSVIFRVLPTMAEAEAKALVAAVPQVGSDLEPYLNGALSSWLVASDLSVEQGTIGTLVKKLENQLYFNTQIEQVVKLTDKTQQQIALLELIAAMGRVLAIQTQLEWLNPAALHAAFDDFKKVKGYDVEKWSKKVAEFDAAVKSSNSFEGVYKNDAAVIAAAEQTLALRREIVLSNPALDFDKIVVTRYELPNNARTAMAPLLGTQSNNWSSQLSARRSGYDASIVELTDIRSGSPKERVIYEGVNGNVVTDVQLHWDAERMIFTSQDPTRHYQIFEVPVAGGGAKQVTQLNEKDIEFFDASYLPSGKLIVTTNLGYSGVPCVNGSDPVGSFSLYDPANHEMRRLTFDQDNVWNPTVMSDGKVLYTRWEYTDLMHYYSRINFTMNPDGTSQKALFGSGALFPNSTFDMQQIPGSANSFIGVISGHHGVARSGRLIIFDPQKARKGVAGMVQEVPFSKREIIPVVKDELVNDVWPQFIKPHPINDKYFFVTAKLSPDGLWGVYLVDVFDNVTLIAEVPGAGLINPIPVFKKATPPVIPETVGMDFATAPKTATVFIQDIYEGEGLKGVPRGTVKALRVLSFEFAYMHSLSDHVAQGIQSGWDIKRELGVVPIESDGSAMFTIPANTTISVQPLDSTGAAIQLMRSWFVGMPGETVSCVGCHEDQNMIAMPKRTIASQSKPRQITTPEGGVRPFTFELEIQPILDRACVACHNGDKLAGGIDYTSGRMEDVTDWAGTRSYSKSYLAFHPYFYRQGPEAEMAVLNPYEYYVDNSELIQMLRKGHHNVKLNPYEWNRLVTWVDFNLPYHSSFPADPHKIYGTTDTLDQKVRRIELGDKYAGTSVDWEQEIADYTAHLKGKPSVKAELPAAVVTKATKVAKVKGWPFAAADAQAMAAGQPSMKIKLGGNEVLEFVYIPAGTYVNGLGEKVVIKKAFYMSATELTNGQVRALIPEHSSRYVGQQWKDHTTPGYDVDSAHLTATKLSWLEATRYASLLAQKSGMKVQLPSAAEWEWAARAGSDQDFWYGNLNTDFAKFENFADDKLADMAVSGIDPRPMGRKDPWFKLQAYIPKEWSVNDGFMLMAPPAQYAANPWGLYDMHGNVAEWTRDAFENGTMDKVVVGASWYDRPKHGVASARRHFLPWHSVWNVGMRLVIEQ